MNTNPNPNLQKPVTEEKLEEAIVQIVNAVTNAMKDLATKEDLKQVEDKLTNRIDGIEHKVDNMQSDVTDTKRKVIDLEHDTPTQRDVDALKKFVGFDKKYS